MCLMPLLQGMELSNLTMGFHHFMALEMCHAKQQPSGGHRQHPQHERERPGDAKSNAQEGHAKAQNGYRTPRRQKQATPCGIALIGTGRRALVTRVLDAPPLRRTRLSITSRHVGRGSRHLGRTVAEALPYTSSSIVQPNRSHRRAILSRSGRLLPDSHLATDWRLMPSFSASAAWLSPSTALLAWMLSPIAPISLSKPVVPRSLLASPMWSDMLPSISLMSLGLLSHSRNQPWVAFLLPAVTTIGCHCRLPGILYHNHSGAHIV